MRLTSTDEIIRVAQHVIRLAVDAYAAPDRTFDELREPGRGRRPGTETKSIRLHQVWMPRGERHTKPDNRRRGRTAPGRPARAAQPASGVTVAEKPEDVGPATRIALRPVDCDIGEMIERKEVVKGYEFDRGQFVTFHARRAEGPRRRELAHHRPDDLRPVRRRCER
jgi:hypothetical protein